DPGSVGPRADLYSLGGTLFWCLTGRLPFAGQNNPVKALALRVSEPPPSVRNVRPEVPAELDALLTRLMAVNPEDRYPSAQAVMPEMNGKEVCRRLREEPPCPHLKIIMLSGRASADELAQMQLAGVDDYLTKPPSRIQLCGRVRAALRLKDAQDRSGALNRDLL